MNALKLFCRHVLSLVIVLLPWNSTSQAAPPLEETLQFGNFGDVHIYRSSEQPKHVVLLVSGDGGWASIDKSLAAALAADGIPGVGLDSLHYFWTRRTPDEAGRDLRRILDHYLAAWQTDKVLLIGYSRGADVLPFMASRLPPELTARTSLIALLGAEHSVDFEFRIADWLPGSMKDAPYRVQPEVEKLLGKNVLCIYG